VQIGLQPWAWFVCGREVGFVRRAVGERGDMSVGAILLIILVLLLIGALPAWPYSRGWGYFPTGGLWLVLLVVLVLVLLGRL
jgi:hypothetical protein